MNVDALLDEQWTNPEWVTEVVHAREVPLVGE